MTLLPYNGPVAAVDPYGPAPEPELVCAHPACREHYLLEAHHVVRRSATGGPARWVALNGVVLLNVRMLCRKHHDQVTGQVGGHKGWIRYLEGAGWAWYTPAPPGAAVSPGAVVDKVGGLWKLVGPLKGVM